MSGKDRSDNPSQTVLDERMAPRRLKESLVPPETGIYLRIEEGPRAGQVYTLSSGGVFLIGREGADIVVDDSKVSRKHAEVGLYGPGAYVVRDLASTNGTLLNDRRVDDRAKLAHWDRIQVGDTTLRFAVLDDSIEVS